MSADRPLISIVTIVFNGESHLERCIQSVATQDYDNWEHIIIDGGSTDRTLPIIEKHRQHFAFVSSEKDEGISDAFNKGIKQCRGSIIGLLNADDFYEGGVFKEIPALMGEADVLYGKLQYIRNGKKDYLCNANHRLLKREMTINHPACFIKKGAYNNFGLYNKSFQVAMDYELLLRMFTKGASFVYTETTLTNMERYGISDRNFFKGIHEVKRAKDMYLGHPWLNSLYLYKQALAITMGNTLPRLGLRPLLKFYRKSFSPIEKL